MRGDILQNRQPQATEYEGKSSAVHRHRNPYNEADAGPSQTHSDGPHGQQGVSPPVFAERTDTMHQHRSRTPPPQIYTTSCSFFSDEKPLDLDPTMNPFETPPFEVADKLLAHCMQTAQYTYPVIAKPFVGQQALDLSPHLYIREDTSEKYSLQRLNPYSDMVPSMPNFSATTEPAFQGLHQERLNPHSPVAHPLVTRFDQYNPPFLEDGYLGTNSYW